MPSNAPQRVRGRYFFVSGPLPARNEMDRARGFMGKAGKNGRRWNAGSVTKKDWEPFIRAAIQRYRVKTIDYAQITFVWYVGPNDRHDPDNIRSAVKFILDAMQPKKARGFEPETPGPLPNDSFKHIHGFSDIYVLNSKTPGVGVHILPVRRKEK